MTDVLTRTYRNEGVRGLYRVSTPAQTHHMLTLCKLCSGPDWPLTAPACPPAQWRRCHCPSGTLLKIAACRPGFCWQPKCWHALYHLQSVLCRQVPADSLPNLVCSVADAKLQPQNILQSLRYLPVSAIRLGCCLSLQGLLPNMIKLAPSAGISWFVFEEAKRQLGLRAQI